MLLRVKLTAGKALENLKLSQNQVTPGLSCHRSSPRKPIGDAHSHTQSLAFPCQKYTEVERGEPVFMSNEQNLTSFTSSLLSTPVNSLLLYKYAFLCFFFFFKKWHFRQSLMSSLKMPKAVPDVVSLLGCQVPASQTGHPNPITSGHELLSSNCLAAGAAQELPKQLSCHRCCLRAPPCWQVRSCCRVVTGGV